MLPLLFSFCFVFSGFLNVNAYAVENFYTTILPNEITPLNLFFDDASSYADSNGWQADVANMYRFSNPAKTTTSMNFLLGATNAFNVIDESFDYYVTLFFTSLGESNSFQPTTFRVTELNGSSGSNVNLSFVTIEPVFIRENGSIYSGYVCTGKLPNSWDGSLRSVYVSGSSGSVGANLSAYISITQVPKDSSADFANIYGAIKEQTNRLVGIISSTSNQLGNKIDSASQDIQQAVEENTEEVKNKIDSIFDFAPPFPADQVEQNVINSASMLPGFDSEMAIAGVFETLLSSPVYPASMTFPGFTINVQGVSYKVWDDISFDLSSLEENSLFHSFMETVRLVFRMIIYAYVIMYAKNTFEYIIKKR